MQINTETRKVETSGVQSQGTFSIKTSAQAFQLLSSGLYSNKIKAVIRELSCNAADAHKMVNTKTPIEIKIPNALDQQFYVKDFGPGLDHDQIMKLYTTYFESTKSDNNDMTGGFGLGSKSPFAYTDSFTVEARQNGIARIYTAFVDDNSIPNIALLSTLPTTDPDGLTVGFPVKTSDFRKFESEALDVLAWFDTPAVLKGTSNPIQSKLTNKNVAYQTNIVSIRGPSFDADSNYRLNSSGIKEQTVIMGNVAYPLKWQDDWSQNPKIKWLMSQNAMYTWPVGKVSIAVSREELAYDRQSLKTLPIALEESFNSIALEIKKQADKIWKTETGLIRDLMLSNLIQYANLDKPDMFKIFSDLVSLSPEMQKAMKPKTLYPFKLQTFDLYIPGDSTYYNPGFGTPNIWKKAADYVFSAKERPGFFENIGSRFGKDIDTRWTLFKNKQKQSNFFMIIPKPNKALTPEYEEELDRWKNELGIELLEFLPRQKLNDNELMVPAQLFTTYRSRNDDQVLTLETPNFVWALKSDFDNHSPSSWHFDGFKKTLGFDKMPAIFLISDENKHLMPKFKNSENLWSFFERELVQPKVIKKIDKIKPMLDGTSSLFSILRSRNRKDPLWQQILQDSKLGGWLKVMDKTKGSSSYDFSTVSWLQFIKGKLPALPIQIPAYYKGDDIQQQLTEAYPLLLQKTLVKDAWLGKDVLQNIANSLQQYVKWSEENGTSNPPHASVIKDDDGPSTTPSP